MIEGGNCTWDNNVELRLLTAKKVLGTQYKRTLRTEHPPWQLRSYTPHPPPNCGSDPDRHAQVTIGVTLWAGHDPRGDGKGSRSQDVRGARHLRSMTGITLRKHEAQQRSPNKHHEDNPPKQRRPMPPSVPETNKNLKQTQIQTSSVRF